MVAAVNPVLWLNGTDTNWVSVGRLPIIAAPAVPLNRPSPPASISFGHAKMEEHARGKDFFNVEAFPKITYKGRISKWNGNAPAAVEGEMTLLGVSKPLNLTINAFKCIQHPMLKREVCGADASGGFKRSDFGMGYGLPMHGDDMKVAIQIEAIKAD